MPGASEKNDAFGWSLDAGDTNGDGYTDIAIGVAEEDLGSKRDAGSYDYFGHSVLLTDASKDNRAELVVGARGENDGAGSVWTLRGTASGITATGAKSFGSATVGGASGLAYFGDVLAG